MTDFGATVRLVRVEPLEEGLDELDQRQSGLDKLDHRQVEIKTLEITDR